jgi:hypothetical protein
MVVYQQTQSLERLRHHGGLRSTSCIVAAQFSVHQSRYCFILETHTSFMVCLGILPDQVPNFLLRCHSGDQGCCPFGRRLGDVAYSI